MTKSLGKKIHSKKETVESYDCESSCKYFCDCDCDFHGAPDSAVYTGRSVSWDEWHTAHYHYAW